MLQTIQFEFCYNQHMKLQKYRGKAIIVATPYGLIILKRRYQICAEKAATKFRNHAIYTSKGNGPINLPEERKKEVCYLYDDLDEVPDADTEPLPLTLRTPQVKDWRLEHCPGMGKVASYVDMKQRYHEDPNFPVRIIARIDAHGARNFQQIQKDLEAKVCQIQDEDVAETEADAEKAKAQALTDTAADVEMKSETAVDGHGALHDEKAADNMVEGLLYEDDFEQEVADFERQEALR